MGHVGVAYAREVGIRIQKKVAIGDSGQDSLVLHAFLYEKLSFRGFLSCTPPLLWG